MKFSMTMLALAAALGVQADNCNEGTIYCGSSLIKKGDYRGQIAQVMMCAGKDAYTNADDYLFKCVGGSQGVIKLERSSVCGRGCRDNGAGKNDSCA